MTYNIILLKYHISHISSDIIWHINYAYNGVPKRLLWSLFAFVVTRTISPSETPSTYNGCPFCCPSPIAIIALHKYVRRRNPAVREYLEIFLIQHSWTAEAWMLYQFLFCGNFLWSVSQETCLVWDVLQIQHKHQKTMRNFDISL